MLKSKTSIICLLRNLSALEIQSRCASNTQRQSNMLTKLLTGKRRPKFKWGDTIASEKPKMMLEGKKTPSKISTRRTIVLNKMFMRHVTDIIASGPIGYELCGLGLEITRVTVCQQYHGLNIFWTATGTDDFDSVERKLESIKGPLRHELHQMQVMGNVPHLNFVRDTHLSYFDELDARIAKADYGEDYEPSNPKSKLKDSFDIHGKAVDIEQSESKSTMPPMRQDVFGLNHALLMGRIKQSMAKSKQAWKTYDEQMTNPSETKPFTFSKSFESIRQEQVMAKQSEDILRDFLVKRKQMRKQQRAEVAEFNAALMEDLNEIKQNQDDYIDAELFGDETDFEQFYDDHEPYEK